MNGMLNLYLDTGSGWTRLDPRAKVGAAAFVVAALIASAGPAPKAIVVATLIALWITARLGLRLLGLTVASLTFFFLTTMALRAIVRGQLAADAVPFGPVRISPAGAVDGLAMCLQIAGVILALALLVRTTRPIQLAEGIELLLAPLKKVGVPAHEAVMMLSIALRFLPITIREVARMQTAQLARGGGVQRGGLRSRAGAVLPLVVPVVIVSLVRAKDLAEAMDARCYRGDVGRTAVREYRLSPGDVVLLSGAFLFLSLAVVTRFL